MNFTNKSLIFPPLLFIFSVSCSSPRINVFALNHSPGFSKKLFATNLTKIEKNAINNPDISNLQFEASKELTIFSYGFTMNEAERIKNEDYDKGRTIYSKAHRDFVRSVNYINSSLVSDYPNFLLWLNDPDNHQIEFEKGER
jgi:hypothetical protein